MDSLQIREMTEDDIPQIVAYWNNSSPDYLRGMGADPSKMQDPEEFSKGLRAQLALPNSTKSAYALICEYEGDAIGHCNLNPMVYGREGKMHLHLWKSPKRGKGIGTEMVKKSLSFFFNEMKLERLLCEPYSLNPAPNKTVEKVGFRFLESDICIPNTHCFEQEINRWIMTKEDYKIISARS